VDSIITITFALVCERQQQPVVEFCSLKLFD